jgi:hypothetical protein
MNEGRGKTGWLDWKALPVEDEDRPRDLLHAVVQEILEAEMTEAPVSAFAEMDVQGASTAR